MADQKLRVIISADTTSLSANINKASVKLKSFGRDISGIGKSLSTTLTLPLALAGGSAIKMASDFEESLNKVDVAFGESSKLVKDFAKTTLEQFGIAEGSALGMTALFGDMAPGMGIAKDDASKLSTELVGLAGDLASFKNVNIEEVTTALSGVFTGETESLKRLGIVMTEVNLKQFAMSKGITKNIKDMTQAEKIALRFQYVLSVTSNAQGDFARTSGGSANQMRIFQEGLKQLGQTFGSLILPMFTDVVTKANEIMKSFINLDDSTKKIILAVGGLVAVVPVLISLFGQLAIIGGAIISPFGLIVGAIATVTMGAVELLHRLNPLVDRMNTFFNLIKSGGNIMSFQALQVESMAKSLQKEADEQNALTKAKKEAQTEIDKLKKGYGGFNLTIDNTKRKLVQVANAITSVTGIQKIDVEKPTASADIEVIDNSMKDLNRKLQLGQNLAFRFGDAMMSAFETMGEGEPFFKVLMDMLAKLIKRMISAVIVSGLLSMGINAIFGGGTISFGKLFGGLSGLGDLSGLSGRTPMGMQSVFPKSIAPSSGMGRLNASRSMQSNQLQGNFQLKGQDLILALQRAEGTRKRILG